MLDNSLSESESIATLLTVASECASNSWGRARFRRLRATGEVESVDATASKDLFMFTPLFSPRWFAHFQADGNRDSRWAWSSARVEPAVRLCMPAKIQVIICTNCKIIQMLTLIEKLFELEGAVLFSKHQSFHPAGHLSLLVSCWISKKTSQRFFVGPMVPRTSFISLAFLYVLLPWNFSHSFCSENNYFNVLFRKRNSNMQIFWYPKTTNVLN